MTGVGVATLLVRLYPRRWRDRYADELLELMSAQPPSAAGVLALLRGAVDAHLNLPDVAPVPGSLAAERVRWSLTATFAAWLAFCLAAGGVAKSTESPAFASAAASHSALRMAWDLGWVALGLSAVAVGFGGLVFTGVAIGQAIRRRDTAVASLLARPVFAAVGVVGSALLLGRLRSAPVHSLQNVALAAGWLTLVLIAIVTVERSAARLMRRTTVPPRLLRFAAATASTTAAAMTIGLVAGACYGFLLLVQDPALFTSANGVLATALPLTWGGTAVIALGAVSVANRAALRVARTGATASRVP